MIYVYIFEGHRQVTDSLSSVTSVGDLTKVDKNCLTKLFFFFDKNTKAILKALVIT